MALRKGDDVKSASVLSEEAKEASRLAGLWLEHPYIAHQAHEFAASAHESEGNQALAAEHRKAAQYWAKKELEENGKRYGLSRN